MQEKNDTNGKKAALSAAVVLSAGFLLAANPGLVDFGVAYYPEAWPESRWETDLSIRWDGVLRVRALPQGLLNAYTLVRIACKAR